MYQYVPVCSGIYRDIPIVVYTGMYGYVLFPKSTYEYVPVCTFQRKYVPTCTIASYKSVHTGIYRYIPTYTRCRGFQMIMTLNTVQVVLQFVSGGPGLAYLDSLTAELAVLEFAKSDFSMEFNPLK